MKTAGIIAEYNPFHNGHAWQLRQTRLAGADAIAVVMSGHFVQRGGPALCDKWLRARMAIEAGADLVLELPTAWAMAPAERFAMGGARILAALGIDLLSFGCEAGSATPLQETAKALSDEQFAARLKYALKCGVSYPRAVSEAAGPFAPLLQTPNNALAVEYIRAFLRLGYPVEFLGVPRAVPHDSMATADGIASASLLRSRIEAGGIDSIRPYMPESAWILLRKACEEGIAPASASRLETALLAAMRTKSAADIARLPDVSEGLENRLVKAAAAGSAEEFFTRAKTKRVIHARLRRIAWSGLIGLLPERLPPLPPYLRPLALNQKGAALLDRVSENSMPLPVYSKAAAIPKSGDAGEVFALECRATDCFGLATPRTQPGGMEYLRSPLFLPDE